MLQAKRNLECYNDFNERNFAPVVFIEEFPNTTEWRIEYHMTRDGFTFLVMGFNGKEAARRKEKYISAFNAMEQRLLPEHAQVHRCIVQTLLRHPSNGQTRPHRGDVPRFRPLLRRTEQPPAFQQDSLASALPPIARGEAQRPARYVVESEVFSPCSLSCATRSIIPLQDNPISV